MAIDDLDVVAGVRDIPAYSSPLIEFLRPVMVISFLGGHLGISGEETAIHLFCASRSSSSTGSVAELRLQCSGVGDGDGDGDLWERGRLAGVI